MKRSIAFLLTALMLITMLPTALLSATAHGIGVGTNSVGNLSIDNAAGEKVPVSVAVDGKSDDTAWAYEDWNLVTGTTGLWDVVTAKNPNFAYKYQLLTDHKYIYGIFVIDTAAIYSGALGDVTVYLNDGSSSACSDKIVVNQSGVTIYNGNTVATDKGAGTIDAIINAYTTDENGVRVYEFRTLVSNITTEETSLTSYVSVAVGGEKLYYPRFKNSNGSNSIDPSAAWPSNSITISSNEILAASHAGGWGSTNGDFSEVLPSEIHVDGELNEGIWQNFTDFYRSDDNLYDYRNGSHAQNGYDFLNMSIGYSSSMYRFDIEDGRVNIPGESTISDPIYFNGGGINGELSKADDWYYDADYFTFDESSLKFKYDIRSDGTNLYGAVVANADCQDQYLYYKLKEYEDLNGTPANGYEMDVPIYFFVGVMGRRNGQDVAFSFRLKYMTAVKYDAASGQWKLKEEWGSKGETGKNRTEQTIEQNGYTEAVWNASAKRTNRYLINMEFKIPLTSVGLMDANGNYWDASTGTYNASTQSIDITHLVAMSNCYSIYSKTPDDTYCAEQYTNRIIRFYSQSFIANSDTAAILNANSAYVSTYGTVKSGDVIPYYKVVETGGAALIQQLPWMTNSPDNKDPGTSTEKIKGVNPSGANATRGYYYSYDPQNGELVNGIYMNNYALPYGNYFSKNFENGYFAYHAWTNGSGYSSCKPVTATKVVANQDQSASSMQFDGVLENRYWTNLHMADSVINGMGQTGGQTGDDLDVDRYDMMSSFYPELYLDNEYLYGAAVILNGADENFKWDKKLYGNSSDAYDMFRIYLNTDLADTSYDYLLDFYIEDYTSSGNVRYDIPTCNVRENRVSSAYLIAESTSESQRNAGTSDTDTIKAGYGIEVSMKIHENFEIDDVARKASSNKQPNGKYYADLTVLEFKVPLSLIGITSETDNDFGFAASLQDIDPAVAQNQRKALFWPLTDNGAPAYSAVSDTIVINRADRVNGVVGTYANTTLSKHNQGETSKYNITKKIFNVDNISTSHTKGAAVVYIDNRKANTLIIDGNPNEEIWNNDDERISVNSQTGTWNQMPLGEDIFDYQYKVFTGRDYVYGMAEINAAANDDTAFTLWVNSYHNTAATHRFDFKIENGVGVCYNNGTKVTFDTTTDISSGGVTHGGMVMHTNNGKTYLEFMLPMDEIETNRDGYQYVVSVSHNDSTLYHPDNSSIASGANTETLWLTHYDVVRSNNNIYDGSGVIITDASKATANTSYLRRAIFEKTEYEGVYKMVLYKDAEGSGSNTLANDLISVYGSATIPAGGFIYVISGGSAISIATDGTYQHTMNYSVPASTTLNGVFSGKSNVYVRFTGIDLENKTINTIYDDQWKSTVPYYSYGYGTDATYTIVELGGKITGNLPETAWDADHDKLIPETEAFYKETITVDGAIADTGWSDDRWIDVVPDKTGNIQNSGYGYCDMEFGYKYQIRTDGEYVYVAAIIDTPAESGEYNKAGQLNGDGTTMTAVPAFRIWIQSQDSAYSDAVSFTHLFDVRPGNTVLSVNTDAINQEIDEYNNHYYPVLNGGEYIGTEGITVSMVGDGKEGFINSGATITYPYVTIRAAENANGFARPQGGLNGTVVNLKYGDTAFYGETVFDAENLNYGWENNEYEANWFAKIDVNNYIYANDHAAFSATDDNKMVVEFKFALEDIGCEDGDEFEYYVEARSQQPSESDSYILFHPNIVIESNAFDGDYARNYYYPYWVWGNTAAVVDAKAMEAMMLRDPYDPVVSLGAQYIEEFEYNGSLTKALRFGLLYDTNYLGRPHNDGATYWDVKEVGLLIGMPGNLSLTANNDIDLSTSKYTINASSDIIKKSPLEPQNTNFADYETFVSYSVFVVPDSRVNSDLTYRGYIEYYPSDDIYYDHWWLTEGTSDDNVEGYTYRETFYSDGITRNYEQVKTITDTEYVEPVLPTSITLSVDNTVNNVNIETISEDGFDFVIEKYEGSTLLSSKALTSAADGTASMTDVYTADDLGKTYTYKVRCRGEEMDHLTHENCAAEQTINVEIYADANNTLQYIITDDLGLPTAYDSNIFYFLHTYDHTLNGTRVVYVPLDNRPVNLDRAEYLAESSGITLIMPDESLVSNTMAVNGKTNADCDQGNPRDLLAWLKEQDADYYVLSVDMLLSGGLVGSRAPFYDTDDTIANLTATLGNYQLTADEQEMIDYITDLSEEKHVVLFDTVMRLATTTGYAELTGPEYSYFRNFFSLGYNTSGTAINPRTQLYGNALTIDGIVNGYKINIEGEEISREYDYTENGVTTHYSFDESVIDTYCLARERKLKLADALYSQCADSAAQLFIGVDDSLPEETIQTNEIRYLETKLINGTDAILFAGADELGLMGLSAVVTELHGELNVKVDYHGLGKDWAADDYDHASLISSINKHIDAVGGKIITSGTADMEILVLTRSAEKPGYGNTNATQHAADVASLVAKLKTNLANNIPTCVIDGSAYEGYGALAEAMLAADINLMEVLGFSAWNTAGNAIGISLSNATGRAAYLKNYGANRTAESDRGFIESIVYSYVKDDAYKKTGGGECFKSPSSFYNEADRWLEGINKSNEILIGINNGVGTVADPGVDVRVSNLHFPWNRDFEADFDIQFVASNNTENLLTSLYRNPTTGAANYNTFRAGDWWWGHESGVNDTTDENNAPWAHWYSNGEGLTDGVTYTEFGSTKDIAKTRWYGLGYRPQETGLEDWELSANANGVCSMPTIKFAEPQDVDQIKMHFLYYLDGGVYLPEDVTIYLQDANGVVLKTIVTSDIRNAETVGTLKNNPDSAYWLNIVLDEVCENVSSITIRPRTQKRNHATYGTLCGWTLMDEIEVYTATPLD